MVNTERLCMGCMNDNGGERICPICGHDSGSDNAAQYLSIGTWLNGNRYIVGKAIEENGDSVVYIGWDNDNNSVVNITEYLPAGVARRSADRLTVGPSEDRGMQFNNGKDAFLSLHTALSKLKISGVLPVIDVFESNGTNYSVCSTVSSISLKDFLIRNGGQLKWEQAKPLVMPLLATLSELHSAGVVHRGISPDTILVGRDGRLYLSGFCIKEARSANTGFAYKMTPGFAAPEQYDEQADVGIAADIYAIGAVLFRCVIGSNPPDAKERLANDRLSIPANAAESVSKGALVAIANALKVNAETRTASAERFKKMVEAAVATPVTESVEPVAPKKKKSDGKKYAIIASAVTAVFFIAIMIGLIFFLDLGKTPDDTASNSSQTSSVEPIFPQVDIKYNDDGVDVPDWTGKTYEELITELNDKNIKLEVVIQGKVYSEQFKKGAVVSQTVKNTKVDPNSEVGVTLSLGSSMITMPDIIGLTRAEATVKLFEAGFMSENVEFRERLTDSEPGTVSGATAKPREKISVDSHIIVDYCPESAHNSTTEE